MIRIVSTGARSGENQNAEVTLTNLYPLLMISSFLTYTFENWSAIFTTKLVAFGIGGGAESPYLLEVQNQRQTRDLDCVPLE
jgi:hypothetical protein